MAAVLRRTLLSVLVACLLIQYCSIAQEDQQFNVGSGGSGSTANNSCPMDQQCRDLPANCVTCNFSSNCVYGQLTNFSCSPLDSVMCEGNTSFIRSAICRYCYQLPDSLSCCAPNTSCSVRGSPRTMYISTCTALDTELCIPPRSYQKRLPCNFTTGIRKTTAILLSITLGGFGVDRFYLGLWMSAIGKILTFGGLGVWSILDVILIVTGYLTPANGSAYIY